MAKLDRWKTWQTRPVHTAIAVVSTAYRIAPRDLRNNGCRAKHFSHPRQVVMWLAREMGASLCHVGHYIGFDHSTVAHACKNVERRRASEPEFAALCAGLLARAREYPVAGLAILRDGAYASVKSQSSRLESAAGQR